MNDRDFADIDLERRRNRVLVRIPADAVEVDEAGTVCTLDLSRVQASTLATLLQEKAIRG